MSEKIDYAVVSEMSKALKHSFKGLSSFPHGFCCGSDYHANHKVVNWLDDVSAKIYKGGLNNDFHNGKFDIGDTVYWMWNLTKFNFEDVIKVMQTVANEHGLAIVEPENPERCIRLVTKEAYEKEQKNETNI